MAWANLSPGKAKAMDRARREREELSSPDPTIRWRVKERITQRNMEELTRILIQQAKRNRKPDDSDYFTIHY